MAKPLVVKAATAALRKAATAALMCMLLSCELLSPGARVIVRLPPPPPHWQRAFPELGFLLEFRDASGRIQKLVGEEWTGGAEITCSKEQNSTVLAYPWIVGGSPAGSSLVLPPAGGFFPLSLEAAGGQEELCLSWKDGCAALVISRVKTVGRDTGLFNVPRMVELMRLADDPWRWDSAAMAECIASGGFTAFDVDPLPSRDVELAVGEGEWFIESPCATVRCVDSGGTLVLPAVPLGAHTLFSMDGSAMSMYVGQRETIVGPKFPYGSRMILACVSTVAPSGPMSTSFSNRTPP